MSAMPMHTIHRTAGLPISVMPSMNHVKPGERKSGRSYEVAHRG